MEREAPISEHSQIILVWLSLTMTTVFGISLGLLLHMIPPPAANQTAEQIKDWYLSRQSEIKIGATIASWSAASILPFWAVTAIQIGRHEKGRRIWAVLAAMSGAMMTIFLVLPPLCFGTAAFAPERAADVTALMHQFGVLALVTTDQYYVFGFVAVAVACLLPHRVEHSAFPRWFGWFTIWLTVMAEAGALAFNLRTGPFAWNGLFVFWIPFGFFAPWLIAASYLLIRSLKRQIADSTHSEQPSPAQASA